MKPRILFVSYTAEWTGPTHSLSLLIKHLSDRFEVAVLLPGRGSFSEFLKDREIRHYSFTSLRRSQIPRMIRLLKEARIDLVYANNTSGVSKNALIAGKLRRLPVIYHVREMGKPGSWRQVGFLRFADAVIAISEATARSIARFVRGEPLVVYNGVTIPPAGTDRTAARAHLRNVAEIPSTATVLLNVGNVQPRKDQEFAIRVFARVAALDPSVYLVIVGRLDRDPDYVRRMRSLIGELGLGERVRLLGFRNDATELMEGADVLLHTPATEPLGRVLLEAMAAGVPVVSTSVDGIKEIVVDGETGYLVERGDHDACTDATARLINDPALRSDLGRRGREHVLEHFTAEETARQVGDIIGRTLGV